uniref:Uncharacterized protein n=1 Tax=Medicago truncatula TaxID=3880 RepID=I3T116_MEDTR|nr:unknown [Medicago truncatula]
MESLNSDSNKKASVPPSATSLRYGSIPSGRGRL